ncbi:peptidoglycan-binding protein [Patescibacteria group bacterium]|nr:MAG: peptidoglycan-binding protein [Patescibacteria group bacterium]
MKYYLVALLLAVAVTFAITLATHKIITPATLMADLTESTPYGTIDRYPPSTTIDGKGYDFGSLTEKPVTITLSCADNPLGSGCLQIYYCADSVGNCDPQTSYTGPITISKKGVSYIKYYSKDKSNNSEPIQSRLVINILHSSIPVTTAKTDGYVFGSWGDRNVTVTLACTSQSSTCANIYWCTDNVGTCTPATNYQTAITISTEGINYLRYYSADQDQNQETVQTQTIIIHKITASSTPAPSQPPAAAATLPAGSLTSIPKDFSFTKALIFGATSIDVKYLQIVLNASGDTMVAKDGTGSAGKESTLFGARTQQAVIRFQEKYAKEILAPIGLGAGTGKVGPSTIAKLNTLLGK